MAVKRLTLETYGKLMLYVNAKKSEYLNNGLSFSAICSDVQTAFPDTDVANSSIAKLLKTCGISTKRPKVARNNMRDRTGKVAEILLSFANKLEKELGIEPDTLINDIDKQLLYEFARRRKTTEQL